MASIFPLSRHQENYGSVTAAPRLARSMTLHASAAVVTFAGLQLGGVIVLADQPGAPALPFVAFALLVIIAIPFARRLQRRWQGLAQSALPSNGLLASFRQDRSRLWRLALLVPGLWIGAYTVVAEATPLF